MTDGVFDEPIAARYDEDEAAMFADDVLGPTVAFLAGLAGRGRVLELAIGTGRVALPLRARGLDVAGIELSHAMVARLRAKPGGDVVPVVIGDMASSRAEGSFSLVYLVFNTITNLVTQADQVACFRNAAHHLERGGHFVVEVSVPPLRRLPPGERFVPFDVSEHHVGVDEIDAANQTVVSHHYRVSDGRGRAFRSTHRWAWPAEYDLMAQLAGLEFHDRWGGWRGEPFTSESTSHVSVWRKPT